jgi:PKD repeat protein
VLRFNLKLGFCALLVLPILGCSEGSTRPEAVPPVADAGGPYNAVLGAPVEFDGSASKDPEGGKLASYDWDFGDGRRSTDENPVHVYENSGTYSVSLVVKNRGGLSSSPATTTAIVRPLEVGSLIRDSFTRTVESGWGAPEIGDRWKTSSAGGFSVNGSAGLISLSERTSLVVKGTGGYGLNVSGLTSFVVNTAPDAPTRFHRLQVYARRNDRVADGDFWYRFQVRLPHSGEMIVRIEKNVAGDTAWLSENKAIPVAFEPGAKYWVRWEAVGVSPSTLLRMKVWRDGTQEPAAWDEEVVSDEPRLDETGTTGFRVSSASDQTTFPIVFAIDELDYREREP